MILSEKHKFIFIKGRKVAGTSVEVLLSSVCGPNDIITPITPIDERYRLALGLGAQNYGANHQDHELYIDAVKNAHPHDLLKTKLPRGTYWNHIALKDIYLHYGSISSDWFIFCVERSPYEKVISLANEMLSTDNYKKSGKQMKNNLKDVANQLSILIKTGGVERVKNIDLYKDCEGVLGVQIFHYETLNAELCDFFTKIGITKYPKLPHLKKGMLSGALDIREMIKQSELKQLNRIFEEEFHVYGYRLLA